MNVIEEANRIKGRLLACKTRQEVAVVVMEERPKVQAMGKLPGDGTAMAHQIANLKLFILKGMA